MNNYKTYKWFLSKESVFVLMLLLSCLALRVFNFVSASICSDEGATMYLAHKSVGELWKISVNDVNPPLYGWIVHYWANLFGYSHVAFRSLSIVCSFLTAVVLFKTGKKYFNFFTGAVSSILFVASNMHIYYAEEARCYAMIGLFCSLSIYFLLDFLKNKKTSALIGLSIINLLILYTHYIAGFLFAAEGLAAIIFFYNRFKLLGLYILSQALILAAFLPWFFSSWFKVDGFGNSWYPKLSYELIRGFFIQTFNAENALILFLILIGLSISFFFIRKNKPKRKMFLSLFILGFLPLTIICLITQYYVRIFFDRYELFATLPLFLFMGYLISSFRLGIWFRTLIVLTYLFFALPNVKVDAFRNQEWDRACIAGSALADDKTSILLYPHYATGCFDYYALNWAYVNDYNGLQNNREKYNVFPVLDTNHIKDFQGKLFDRVMFYSTHYWENDNKAIEKFLLQTHDQVFYKEFWGVRLYIFQKRKLAAIQTASQ